MYWKKIRRIEIEKNVWIKKNIMKVQSKCFAYVQNQRNESIKKIMLLWQYRCIDTVYFFVTNLVKVLYTYSFMRGNLFTN